MIMNWNFLCCVLLVIQFTHWSVAEKSLPENKTCEGNICQVTPSNIHHIQEMIKSDRTFTFKNGTFQLRMKRFIVIEDVSNVAINGGGLVSHIECSEGARFGLYFRNVTNITVTGLNITNCSDRIPQNLVQYIPPSANPCDHKPCRRMPSATILIQASQNVTLSRMHISHSPGMAVAAINVPISKPEFQPTGMYPTLSQRLPRQAKIKCELSNPQSCIQPDKENNYDIEIRDSSISDSQRGSLILHRISAKLSHSTLNNNSIGILSTSSDMMIEDVDVSHSQKILLEGGSAFISGSVNFNQSSLYMRNFYLTVDNKFSEFLGQNGTAVFTAIDSELDISNNSKLSFKKCNLSANSSALIIIGTSIKVQDSSSMEFTSNIASDMASIFASIQSTLIIGGNSSLILSDNFVNNSWLLMAGFDSRWTTTGENDVITIVNNTVIDGGNVAEFHNSTVRLHNNTHVLLKNNSALRNSSLLAVNNATFKLSNNSKLLFTKCNLSANSSALITIGTSIKVQDSSSMEFTSNTASDMASIFASIQSNLSIGSNSSLILSDNFVNNSWLLMAGFDSRWTTTGENDVITIVNNTVINGGSVAEFHNSTVRLHNNTHVLLEKNSALKDSSLLAVNNATFKLYHRSKLELLGNKAEDNSTLFMISQNISFYNTTHVSITHNTVTRDSSIILLQPTPSGLAQDENSIYYKTLIDHEIQPEDDIDNVTGTDNILIQGFTTSLINGFNLIIDKPDALVVDDSSLQGITAIIEHSDDAIISLVENTITEQSVGLRCSQCMLLSYHSAKLVVTNNTCNSSSYVILLNNATTLIQDMAMVNVAYNEVFNDSSTLLIQHGQLTVDRGAHFSVIGNNATNGFSVLFFSTVVHFLGTVLVYDNMLTDFGALNVINSQVHFQGQLECSGNKAESGAIIADNSDIYFTDEANFSKNSAYNGGAISLVSSVMHVTPNATVVFTRNFASGLGGAIYITNPRTRFICDALSSTAASCAFQVLDGSPDNCDFFSLEFNQNTAKIAGNAVYGDRTAACIPSNSSLYCTNCSAPDFSAIYHYNGFGNSSDLSNFTSDPTRVCFCKDGIPDCYQFMKSITVTAGEIFHLSLATVGYGLGTVPGSVVARTNKQKVREPGKNSFGNDLQYSQDIGTECRDLSYSIISENASEGMLLAVNTLSFGRSLKEVQAVVDFQLTKNTQDISPILRSPYDSLLETFFHIPVFVKVILSPCPVGFQLVNGRCVCAEILLENQIDMCSIVNRTPVIHIPSPYWVGLPADKSSPILIHTQCPFDYCQSQDTNITSENTDRQCQFERSGVLCGQCSDGLSMVLGSSECKKCSNVFLTTIVVFALAGLALVVFLTLLNMTVSVSTINGLILFANIVQANRSAFLPPSMANTSVPISVLSAFIAWLNLDLGIPTCLFDGLTTYVKTWLQFVFPLYIMAIVTVIIITSYYSTRVTKLFGINAVSILATLVLLSYTKILRILIAAFSFTTIKGTQDHFSVVWLYDGNVRFFGPKHSILFLTALLVLLLLGIPYTAMLILAPWMQKSKYRCISMAYNKFKPLFDAYMGPYKDNYRYWTGMLLLARVILIVLFSSFTNTNALDGPVLNLFLLTLSASFLLAITAAVKPYKTTVNNAIEAFHLTNLVVLAAASLYVSNTESGPGNQESIYVTLVGISLIFFIYTTIGHGYYRLNSWYTSNRRLKASPDPQSSVEQQSTVEGSGRSTGELTQTEVTTRERSDSMFRESVLDLTCYD